MTPKHQSADLEFPDWSGMEQSGLKLTPDAAFRLSQEYLALVPPEVRRRHQELYFPCPVEFVL